MGAVACLSSMLALSFANDQAWQFFLTQGVAFGLFVAFGLQPAIIVAGQHFKKKRALVMGMVTGGSSLGAVCFSIMFARLIPSIGFGELLSNLEIRLLIKYSLVNTCRWTCLIVRLQQHDCLRSFADNRLVAAIV